MNRRKFFEDSGRWLSAAALGLLGGYLALKQADSNPPSCNENPFCGHCGKLNSCGKPRAAAYRQSPGQTDVSTKNKADGKR
ncbi:MAG: hypothetical protein H6560_12165 [Lewinellaceae bacterium]|nr:hypothetical protein [Lewinellaceae bacterium]